MICCLRLNLELLSAGVLCRKSVDVCFVWSTTSLCKCCDIKARSIRPKFPKIPVQNQMERKISGNSCRKFWSTSRGCLFFWKYGNSGNFPFHLTSRYESAPVPLVVPKSVKMAVSRHHTGCKTICHSSSVLLIAYPLQKP